jgi:hypothetical protein
MTNTPLKAKHPSIAERKKLEESRRLRLAQALRDNLKKRKAQVRGRSTAEG